MSSQTIKAIDVHGHYGHYFRPVFHEHVNGFMSAGHAEVLRRARDVNIEWTLVSPLRGLMPRGRSIAEVEEANVEAARLIDQTDGLLQYVIIDPRQPRIYEQAGDMLKHPRRAGIKIHGEEHMYFLEDYGDALFTFASEHKAVVLAHSGDAFTIPMDFVPYADRYPDATLILAHLGHSPDADQDPCHQIRAIQKSRHGNIYTDTSSAASLMPGLIEWAVREVGPERILFGTDTPLYAAAMQRARIDSAELDEDAKSMILRGNALRLFGAETFTSVASEVTCDQS